MKRITLFICLIALLSSTKAFSQKEKSIGGIFTTDYTEENSIRIGGGFIYEQRISSRLGIESGLYYRNIETNIPSSSFYNTNSTTIIEHYISFPLLLKYYSPIVNLSAGLNLDGFFGWHERYQQENVYISSYKVNPPYYLGFTFKISKILPLTDKLFLEPEIHFSPAISKNRNYLGMGFSVKYKL